MAGGPDPESLRIRTRDEILRFRDQALAAGISRGIVGAASYALCAAIDEAVLSTAWGRRSSWAARSLLLTLHNEAQGGIKFFESLARILKEKDPASHPEMIELVELYYLCLAFGFAGKYPANSAELTAFTHDLYKRIESYRGLPPAELSVSWQGVQDRRHRLIRYVPWWVVAAVVAFAVTVTFIVLYSRLGSRADAVLNRMAALDLFTDAPAAAPPSERLTLKKLLQPEADRGALLVEERGTETIVTLLTTDLFGSGSATLNPRYEATLRKVGEAADRIPGLLSVEGHTDDQPIRSARFASNNALSRARAVTVADILKKYIRDGDHRIEVKAWGDSKPRYEPASSPENRAKNRRVEISHRS
jgi:type VI secretion system protein ImpK